MSPSTLYICWAAQAGLYHFHGVPKHDLGKKMFGVFEHTVSDSKFPLSGDLMIDSMCRIVVIPKSEVQMCEGARIDNLVGIAGSGLYIAMSRGGRDFFITYHSEYSPMTLDTEYRRDLSKGLPIDLPTTTQGG
ncbi:hypothetical protein MASR1M31_01940 [Porphyromonadaceae bacterium]